MITVEQGLSKRSLECGSDILLVPQNPCHKNEGKVFLYFILVNAEKLLEMVKYTLGRNDDGMKKLWHLQKEGRRRGGKM